MAVEKIKLIDVFRLVPKPQYIVGTTYTLSLAFFESIVLPCIDRSALRRCVIVADRFGFERALDEATALENAGQSYVIAAPPTNRCLHAKVWFIASDAEAALLVGSGNLTQSGFISNAELFDVIYLSPTAPGSAGLLQSIREFLNGLAALWHAGSDTLAVESLEDVSDAVANLPAADSPNESEARFLHSLSRSLISQLPASPDVRRVSIAAPFFGGELAGIELFERRYPQAKLRIFPAVHSDDSVDVPHEKIMTKFKTATTARLRLEPKPGAFPHLKLYALEHRAHQPWLLCTSANCTRGALDGSNIEAGILRRVTATAVREYFQASEKPLPIKSFERWEESQSNARLHLASVDNGHSLTLSVAELSAKHLPLRNVVVTVKTGNAAATTARRVLFSSNRSTTISWSDFSGWSKPRNRAIRVDVRGHTVSGHDIVGSAFLENRLLLTSDPIHRSAWRGALALLDIEAVPELADIAAIFSLARGVFDASLLIERSSTPSAAPHEAPHVEPGIAVWPPQPDLQELHRSISKTATGQLRWFQEVMRTLLATPKHETHSATAGDTGADNESADENEQQREERQERVVTMARRLWDHATRDYGALWNKLQGLEPTANNASKVWPIAVFTFLATMAVLQASIRISSDVDWTSQIDELNDDFLRLMFAPRNQSEDYCSPKGARYRQETFPPLAEDLAATFNERPHPELAAVLFVMVADKEMRSTPGMFKIMWQQRVRQIWATGFRCDPETKDVCRRIWRRFLLGHSQNRDPAAFDKAVDELCAVAEELKL